MIQITGENWEQERRTFEVSPMRLFQNTSVDATRSAAALDGPPREMDEPPDSFDNKRSLCEIILEDAIESE